MKNYKTLDQFIKQLFPIPASIKLKESEKVCRRVRALTVLLLVTSATVWFWSLVLTLLYLFFKFDILLNIYFAYVVSALMALQIWGFYRFANFRIASMLFSLTYFLMALSLALMSGGFHSPGLPILLSSPVVSFRAGGKDEGIMNAIFVGITGLALAGISALGISMTNLLSGVNETLFFSISWVVTLAIISSCLVTYDLGEQ